VKQQNLSQTKTEEELQCNRAQNLGILQKREWKRDRGQIYDLRVLSSAKPESQPEKQKEKPKAQNKRQKPKTKMETKTRSKGQRIQVDCKRNQPQNSPPIFWVVTSFFNVRGSEGWDYIVHDSGSQPSPKTGI
jgi:hypothetical protein